MAAPAKPTKNLLVGPTLGPKFSEQLAVSRSYMTPSVLHRITTGSSTRRTERCGWSKSQSALDAHPLCTVSRTPPFIAFNSVSGAPAEVTDEKLYPTSSLNGQGGGFGRAPFATI